MDLMNLAGMTQMKDDCIIPYLQVIWNDQLWHRNQSSIANRVRLSSQMVSLKIGVNKKIASALQSRKAILIGTCSFVSLFPTK